MTVKAQVARQGLADRLLLVLAASVLAAGIAGFYVLHEQPQVVRVLVVLVAITAALVLAVRSRPGARLWGFLGESRTELRRVVWPSRRETVQMTGVVFVAAVVVGLMLWFFDWVISLAIGAFMGLGG